MKSLHSTHHFVSGHGDAFSRVTLPAQAWIHHIDLNDQFSISDLAIGDTRYVLGLSGLWGAKSQGEFTPCVSRIVFASPVLASGKHPICLVAHNQKDVKRDLTVEYVGFWV